MEAMKHYGWGLVDSDGVMVSSLVFKSLKAVNKLKEDLKKLHPDLECALVELFVRNGDTWDR